MGAGDGVGGASGAGGAGGGVLLCAGGAGSQGGGELGDRCLGNSEVLAVSEDQGHKLLDFGCGRGVTDR